MARTAMSAVIVLLIPILFPSAMIAADRVEAPAGPFPSSVYRERRETVMEAMGEGIAVLYARGSEDRDGYRQDSDFYYLTGNAEPGAVLVLAPGQRVYQHQLFLAPRDPEAERWTGEREPLSKQFLGETGFDRIARTTDLNYWLMSILETPQILHVLNQPAAPDEPLPAEQELYGKIELRIPGVTVNNLSRQLPTMRAVKEDRELDRMRRAINATIAGHRAAARAIGPGIEENWVESLIMTEFKKHGSLRPAFGLIVGSGKASTVLHYPDHNETIEPGSLVVVDIGADNGHYAADLTRTYPADGTFNERQRLIYETVLLAQRACIDMVRPGIYMDDLQLMAEKIIGDAGFADYFIHDVSHFLGLDVHDVGLYNEPLEEGMVITIEPGIYIPEESLGVRIEDDVLVITDGAEVLSGGLPRSASEIERMMRGD